MAIQGDDTIDKRLALIQNQKASIEHQIAELSEIQKVLTFKQWYYETAKKRRNHSGSQKYDPR